MTSEMLKNTETAQQQAGSVTVAQLLDYASVIIESLLSTKIISN